VLFGGAIFALTAGAYYWWPKMFGTMLDEGIGKLHFWLMLIGFNLTFFPMHIVGLHGMPRRVYTYSAGFGFETLNLIETVGSFVLASSFLVFMYNMLKTWKGGAKAPADPWNGATLEWAIPSPPAGVQLPRRDHGARPRPAVGHEARQRREAARAAAGERAADPPAAAVHLAAGVRRRRHGRVRSRLIAE